MPEQQPSQSGGEDPSQERAPGKGFSARLIIVLVVIAVFGGVLFAKTLSSPKASSSAAATSGTSGTSQTSTRSDAVADYEAALKTGKPIYVLFHSLTCQPCVEISAIADEVIPSYKDKIAFVDAVTDDPSAQQLASRFQFQYIPTSFFLEPDGTVVDSFTGVLAADDMRARLDSLVVAE